MPANYKRRKKTKKCEKCGEMFSIQGFHNHLKTHEKNNLTQIPQQKEEGKPKEVNPFERKLYHAQSRASSYRLALKVVLQEMIALLDSEQEF